MRTVAAHELVPGARVADAEALWYDLRRWPGFVDGFGSMALWEGEWPARDARVVWDSRPDGRGRVAEQVIAHEPGASQRVGVEDHQLRGEQTIRFAQSDRGCRVTLELTYELKRPGVGGALADLFFVRHALRASLRRTLERFAIELRADRDLAT
ncbi:MAG TPA: SRPBCC family protein [Solirubrobacteraceae bacterium]|jgi:hypothetical protein|nr:SRPBCC family protein [Solirubrobacteraceae bacterium]